MRFSVAVAAAATIGMAAAAIEPVIMKDRHFYYEDSGKPFYVGHLHMKWEGT